MMVSDFKGHVTLYMCNVISIMIICKNPNLHLQIQICHIKFLQKKKINMLDYILSILIIIIIIIIM